MPLQHIHPYAVVIPEWASLPLIFSVLPFGHFLLLRNKSLSNEFVAWTGFIAAIMLPLMFPCPNLFIYLCGAASSQVIYALRFLQLGTIDRTLNSSFSLPEYVEFIMTGETMHLRNIQEIAFQKENLRRKEAKLPLKTAKKRTGEISPRDFTLQFWIYYVVRMGYTLGVYIFCLAYFRKYGYQERFGVLTLGDWVGLREHLMFSALVLMALEFNFGNVNMGASLLFGSPFSFSFNFPFLATSLRDFWSFRWNKTIKDILHSLAFIPTLRFLSSINPPISPKYTAQNRTPTAHLILAGLSAFFLSSLLHEFLVFMYLPSQPAGENLLFSMGQGILTFAQGYAQRATGFGSSWGTGVVGDVLGWAGSLGLLVWMSPLFTRPYAADGLFVNGFTIPVPDFVIEYVKSCI